MTSLFLDTSHCISVGLLDESWDWMGYEHLRDKKSSAIIHDKIYRLLEENNLKAKDLKNTIQVAGPGSYTGIRLSEGISQILGWHQIKLLSFYHFEVPNFLGVEEGIWLSQAYKGELFLYEWKQGQSKNLLLPINEAAHYLTSVKLPLFTHYLDSLHDKKGQFLLPDSMKTNIRETQLMVKNQPKELFSQLAKLEKHEEPFYYRSVDKEFKKGR